MNANNAAKKSNDIHLFCIILCNSCSFICLIVALFILANSGKFKSRRIFCVVSNWVGSSAWESTRLKTVWSGVQIPPGPYLYSKRCVMNAITGMATAISDGNLQLPAAIAVFLIVAMGMHLLLKRTGLAVITGIVAAAVLMGLLYLY